MSITVVRALALAMLALAAFAQQSKPQTAAKAPAQKGAAAAKSRATGLPAGVPAGAEPLPGFAWRHVDKKGTAWIYRQTPFGMVHEVETEADIAARKAAAAAPAPVAIAASPMSAAGSMNSSPLPISAQAPSTADVAVREIGDAIEFTRQTPFGPSRWTTKKINLSDEEKQIWEQAKAARERR